MQTYANLLFMILNDVSQFLLHISAVAILSKLVTWSCAMVVGDGRGVHGGRWGAAPYWKNPKLPMAQVGLWTSDD